MSYRLKAAHKYNISIFSIEVGQNPLKRSNFFRFWIISLFYRDIKFLKFDVSTQLPLWGRQNPATYFLKVVIARYRFSLDIVETLHIHYLTLLECMCKFSELLTTQNPKKSSLNKNLLYTGFPITREKSTIFLIAVNSLITSLITSVQLHIFSKQLSRAFNSMLIVKLVTCFSLKWLLLIYRFARAGGGFQS